MAIGIFEIIIIIGVIFIWISITNKGESKQIIPRDKWNKTKKEIQKVIYEVKDIEFEVKDTIKEVEEDIKRKHKQNDSKNPKNNMES